MRTAIAALASICAIQSALAGELAFTVRSADGKPVQDAAVWLDPVAAPARSDAAPAEITQRDQEFEPFVTVVSAGSRVTFPNRDKVKHHVYSFSAAKTFEIQLYSGTPTEPILFDKPGVVVMGCNIHDWMLAYIAVVDTPWFGKSNASGAGVVGNLPAGKYTLHAWHPFQLADVPAQTVEITAGPARRDASVTIGLGPSQRKPHHPMGDNY